MVKSGFSVDDFQPSFAKDRKGFLCSRVEIDGVK